MGKKLIAKIENQSRQMPLILFICSVAAIGIFASLHDGAVKMASDKIAFYSMLVPLCAVAVISLVMVFGQRKFSTKHLTDEQKKKYAEEINSDKVRLYTAKGGYFLMTESFIVENSHAKTLFSFPVVTAIDDLLCVTTYTYYDYIMGRNYQFTKFVDRRFKDLGLTNGQNAEDTREMIAHIVSKAPWVEVIEGEDAVKGFDRSVSSKKDKTEYINKIAEAKKRIFQ